MALITVLYLVSTIATSAVMGFITLQKRKDVDVAGIYMRVSFLVRIISIFQGMSMISPTSGWAYFCFIRDK